ncbi:GAF domain-containing protein [Marinovum sp. 2_MG-2023]|uniref:GAF domain-containing protein n=1 Tax=unclassified Marinovum TaxID=2647166 RepID=UPI0026E27CF2|nr:MULTISPECIES: GAF domain-containing protein [unclassified Marinovum]MDO6729845.1 GAF domain-containing protein [Marinovum sp. 2_MG-2023]MDO6779659.1 GAF domain-containing protein [Marinovum sp. 1_MG-2023]
MTDLSTPRGIGTLSEQSDDLLKQSELLVALQLVDAPAEDAFDKFTRLVVLALNTPVALVCVVEEGRDRQYFKSEIGLESTWAKLRQTPLTHSFCQYVKRDNQPMIITDALNDPRVRDNLAVPDLGIKAYLGVPFHDCHGHPIGALCAIDTESRRWSENCVRVMTEIAACVTDQVRLRIALRQYHW